MSTLKKLNDRQLAIIEILSSNEEVSTQDYLVALLKKKGFEVRQSTVARDLNDMGITKKGRHNYVLTEALHDEVHREKFANITREMSTDFLADSPIISIKTKPGYGRSFAVNLEKHLGNFVFGTISGEDCLIVICKSIKDKEHISKHLKHLKDIFKSLD